MTQNPDLADQVMFFDAFTDIEFNPNRQINCQAAAAALYVSLRNQGRLEEAMSSQENFRRLLASFSNPTGVELLQQKMCDAAETKASVGEVVLLAKGFDQEDLYPSSRQAAGFYLDGISFDRAA